MSRAFYRGREQRCEGSTVEGRHRDSLVMQPTQTNVMNLHAPNQVLPATEKNVALSVRHSSICDQQWVHMQLFGYTCSLLISSLGLAFHTLVLFSSNKLMHPHQPGDACFQASEPTDGVADDEGRALDDLCMCCVCVCLCAHTGQAQSSYRPFLLSCR